MTRPAGGAPDLDDLTPPAAPPVETPWRLLDPRMLVVGPLGNLVGLAPLVLILLVTGQGELSRLWFAAGAAVLVVLFGVLRWRTTRYRITAERVELHTGLFHRQRRSVPRDRIRTVDTTSTLVHRLFGLSVVKVSAASGAGQESGLSLDAVSKPEAERLRLELLARSPAAAGPGEVPAAAPPAEELARLRWSWIRFAPLTVSSLAAVGAVVGTAFNLLDDIGMFDGLIEDAGNRFAAASLLGFVLVVVVLLAAIAVVGAMLLFAERWYGYRLTREPDGTLRVKRGLLTRRSLSVSEERLRGVELSEPLLLRAGRGAQSRAISTGIGGGAQGGALGPPAPVGEGHRVASAVLREGPVTRTPLRRHPRAALVRRLNRAVGTALLLAGAVWVLDATLLGAGWAGPVAVAVLLPVAALLAVDRYRNLGHALVERYVVSRRGSLRRRTVALQRAGVIGWTVRQSVFQRRSGLATLEAVTAAGEGGYAIPDMAAADAVDLADEAVPGLLAPFRT
ncbi:MAG: PH domain-containing protein [Pseudonocardia sp.]